MSATNDHNTPTIFGVLLIATVIIITIWMISKYSQSIEDADDEAFKVWFTEEFVPQEIRGEITHFEPYERCYYVLRLKTSKERFSYNLNLCNEKSVREFTSRGDSIFKRSGSDQFKIVKQNNTSISFRYSQ